MLQRDREIEGQVYNKKELQDRQGITTSLHVED